MKIDRRDSGRRQLTRGFPISAGGSISTILIGASALLRFYTAAYCTPCDRLGELQVKSATRGLGLVEVRELSDWQMVRLLASENATQRGSTAAACLDAVAAIAQVLAYNLLRWDEATFVKNFTKVDVDYASCWGRLEARSGIGRDCIRAVVTKDRLSDRMNSIRRGTVFLAGGVRFPTRVFG